MKLKLQLLILFFSTGVYSSGFAQSYFRTVASGDWTTISTWESSLDNITRSPATAMPSSTDYSITIQSPHALTISSTMTVDEVTVNLGASLTITGAITLTVNNGVGIDLIVNGTITDNLTTVGGTLNFAAGAKWSMSSGATLIKTTGSASNVWQQNYQGGISTIPATANWILRKTGVSNPPISTTITGGAFYPNLIIENFTASQWVTAGGSTFTGSTAFPTIKGNFDIGGSGTNTVDFLNAQTNALPTRVLGNMIIRTGSVLRNGGTGIAFNGNLTVNGTMSYSGTSKVVFEGGNAQTVSNTSGNIAIYNLEINKSANDVTLNKALTVDNNALFVQGRIITTSTYPLSFGAIATASGFNNSSFVSGPCIKTGTNGFTFPVGKLNNVQPIGINAGAAGIPSPFWTENFATGTGWTLNNVQGPEGSDPNPFYIGAWEGGGIPPGGCGVANNGNNTLHVGSVFNPTGGAAYDAGGLCGIWFCPQTNRRARSPAINCTGYSAITLGFNYIENGSGSIDNMTLWYFDGIVWTQIADPPKTLCCGGVACTGFNQGQWTAYSIALPASANNNPNVRIGFKWQNNDDGVGTDPSFAVDNITLSSVVPEVFSAEYFPVNPQGLFGSNLEPTLDHISYCEYWDLSRLSGSSNRQVTLTWDNNSCGVTSLNDLRVARYDAGSNIWRDHGNNISLLTGTTSSGTITSSLISTSFCPYTLASVNALNPLPVSYLHFDVENKNNRAHISWSTSAEPLNSLFRVERSEDLRDVSHVATVPSKGNASAGSNYEVIDYNILSGLTYYRICQTDINGTTKYTEWKSVEVYQSPEQQLVVVSDESGIEFSILNPALNENADIKIYNSLGCIVLHKKTILEKSNRISLQMPKGIYMLTVDTEERILTQKFRY